MSYVSVPKWNEGKSIAYKEMLDIIKSLDETLANAKKIESNNLINRFRDELTAFLLSLTDINISGNSIDFGNLNIKQEYIDNTIEQLSLVDSTQFLIELSQMQITAVPLEIEKYRNSFVESKLKKANSIAQNVEDAINDDFGKLHKQIAQTFEKFYAIANESSTDGEKAEKARKVIKVINPHRQLLDKLEEKLTEANEIKRQLTLHEKRLKANLDEQTKDLDKKIKETPDGKDMFVREKESIKYVNEEYFKQIESSQSFVERTQELISAMYKILDNLEIALKSAIPSEDELKKYSSIGFKYQDLLVRLELAKSQLQGDAKDFKTMIDTSLTGFQNLIELSQTGKDLFMRNTMMGAIFASINALYDIVDNPNKTIEVSQTKFVTSKLEDYSSLCTTFVADMGTFRRVANNSIRDIAITLGKPLNIKGSKELIDIIEVTINQLQQLIESLDKNHKEQTQVLNDILSV